MSVDPVSYLASVTTETQILKVNTDLQRKQNKQTKTFNFKRITLVREIMETLKMDVHATGMITCAACTESIKA